MTFTGYTFSKLELNNTPPDALNKAPPLKIATEGIKLGDQRIHQTEPGKITLGENVHFDSESLHFGDHKIKDEGGFLKFDSNNFNNGWGGRFG